MSALGCQQSNRLQLQQIERRQKTARVLAGTDRWMNRPHLLGVDNDVFLYRRSFCVDGKACSQNYYGIL